MTKDTDERSVESEEFRKARKRHYTEAMMAGVRATLAKGREIDAVHDEPVTVGQVMSVAEALFDAMAEKEEVGESIPERKEPVVGELADVSLEEEFDEEPELEAETDIGTEPADEEMKVEHAVQEQEAVAKAEEDEVAKMRAELAELKELLRKKEE